ncbi:MAG: hypothetical protein ABIB79_05440 [archaeon]
MYQSKRTIILSIVLITILATSLVSAEFWACFDRGQKAEYCNDYKPDKTCASSSGCQWCMSVYDEANDCYVHGIWPKCNQLAPKCSTFGNGGGGSIDSDPPEFNLIKPTEDELFTSRKVLVEFSLDEKADVYYLDLIGGRGRWTKICNDCSAGNPAYSKERSFSEGYNHIQFKAADVVGNEAFEEVSFFVDSRDPRILKTNPTKGFADGTFEVQFKEDNPKILKLYYGANQKTLGLEDDCHEEKSKVYCDTYVDLGSYDGDEIEYWFTLEDIAGNVDESKHRILEVDTTFPVIENDGDFWDINGKYVYFEIEIDEDNFDEAFYTYEDSRGRIREKRLCSRLKDGICEKKVRFNEGHHDITINVVDEAGNMVGVPVNFDMVY